MPGSADPRVAVVIPAYRAAGTVTLVVSQAGAAVPGASLYVVDDGSADDTAARARAAGATVLRHGENRGKGAALATGIERALRDGAAWVATLDADGQHPPDLLPSLLEPLRQGQADLVLGARARTASMPWQRRVTNWLSATLASRIAGVGMGSSVADAQTGYRAFTRSLALAIRPSETRYDYETAFLLAALAGGYRVAAVPVPTIYAGAPSHFRSFGDTWRLARVFARYGRRILFGSA